MREVVVGGGLPKYVSFLLCEAEVGVVLMGRYVWRLPCVCVVFGIVGRIGWGYVDESFHAFTGNGRGPV